MRILFIGDIVGKVGRDAIKTYLPKLKQTHRPTVTIVNAENAAHGKGLTEKIYKELLREGVDFMTMGNHTYGQRHTDTGRCIREVSWAYHTLSIIYKIINLSLTIGVITHCHEIYAFS